MGILLAFAVGYVVGARAGNEGFNEVVDSLKAVRDSEEFHALLTAVRDHAGSTLEELATLVKQGQDTTSVSDVLARVRNLVRSGPTSPES
jgi:hypothetical protein